MSIHCNAYLIWGIRLDYKTFDGDDGDEWYARHEKYIDSAFEGKEKLSKFNIIFDGMDGKYIYVGHIVAKGKNYAQSPFEGLPDEVCFEIDTLLKPFIIEKVKEISGISEPNMQYHFVRHFR